MRTIELVEHAASLFTAFCVVIALTCTSIVGDETMPFRDFKGDEFVKTKTVNVLNYGAEGDGATECHTAFTNALAAVSGGGKLFIPSGTYVIEDSLLLDNSDIEICGAGNSTILLFTNAGDAFYTNDTDVLRNITLRDLDIQTNNPNAGAAVHLNQPTNGASRILFSNITVSKTGSGAWDYGIRGLFALCCGIRDSCFSYMGEGATAILLETASGHASNAWTIDNVRIIGIHAKGIHIKGGSSHSLTGVIFDGDYTDACIKVEGQYQHPSLSITGCHLENTYNGGLALDLEACDFAFVGGSKLTSVSNPANKIGADSGNYDARNVTITGCYISKTLDIKATAAFVRIENNLFFGAQTWDVINDAGTKTFVRGNSSIVGGWFDAIENKTNDTAFTLGNALALTTEDDISIDSDAVVYQHDSGTVKFTNGFMFPYYYAEEELSLNMPLTEGGGATAHDGSRHVNDGTIASGTWTSAKWGYALEFNGTDTKVTIPDDASLQFGTGDFTIEFWVYVDSSNSGYKYIFSKGLYYGAGNWALYAWNNDITFRAEDEDDPEILWYSHYIRIPYETWTHIAIVKSGRDLIGYADGVRKRYVENYFRDGADFNKAVPLYIGSAYAGSPVPLTGKLAHVRFYKRALSAGEIGAYFIRSAPSTVIPRLVTADRYRIVGTDGNVAFSVIDGRASAPVINGGVKALSFANPLAVDMDDGNVFTLTTTGDCTINASDGQAGQRATFIITDDATGSHAVTFGTNFKANGTLTGTADKTATVDFACDGTDWCEVSRTTEL
jgi:hypothetical protein